MCSPVAHSRNLGHLERKESWLRCEVRSLLCYGRIRQSSQDPAQLGGGCMTYATRGKDPRTEQERLAAACTDNGLVDGDGNGNGNLSFVTWKVGGGRCALERPDHIGRQHTRRPPPKQSKVPASRNAEMSKLPRPRPPKISLVEKGCRN